MPGYQAPVGDSRSYRSSAQGPRRLRRAVWGLEKDRSERNRIMMD